MRKQSVLFSHFSDLPSLSSSQANYFSLSSFYTESEAHFNGTWDLESNLPDVFNTNIKNTGLVLRGIEMNDSIVALTKGNSSSEGDSQLSIVWCGNGSPWQLDMGQMFRISDIVVEMLDGTSGSNLDTMLTIKYRKTKNDLWKDATPVRIISKCSF